MAVGIISKNGDYFNAFFTNASTGGISWTNILVAFFFAIIVLIIQALLVQIFWNLVIPKIFITVPCLDYWNALALTLLVDILFL